MRRGAALKLLREHKRELDKRYGITRLGIFGSVARDEAVDSSDVDLVVEMPPDMFARVNLKEDFETILRSKVEPEKTHRPGGVLCMTLHCSWKSRNRLMTRNLFRA